MEGFFNWLKTITLVGFLKGLLAVAAFTTGAGAPAYLLLKSIAVNAAETQFKVMLKKSGLDPEAFKNVPEAVQTLKDESAVTKSDVTIIKEQQKLTNELLKSLIKQNNQ